jgi:hypothetical protein
VIARRSTAHGSGLGTYRWVVEQSFALLHWFRRLRLRWKIRDDIPRGLPQPRLRHHLLAPLAQPLTLLGRLKEIRRRTDVVGIFPGRDAGCVTSDPPTTGALRSTAPATTATTIPSSPPTCRWAPAKTPSTSPAGSIWATPQPGPDPRRTYGPDH